MFHVKHMLIDYIFFEFINSFADFCFKNTFLYKRKFNVSRETLLLTSIFIAMYLLN